MTFASKNPQFVQLPQLNKNKLTRFKKSILASAISLSLSFSTMAAEFNVTENIDDGTGLIANTLSWAILQANTIPGDDVITLNTDVRITGVMKRLIDSNTTLHSDATKRTIDGDNNFRPLFIKSGNVLIENIDMVNGRAKGGGAREGGGGSGMGGSVFIYDGNVSLNNISVLNSTSDTEVLSGTYSAGGGMYGSVNTQRGGGGGLFASSNSSIGAYGGYGNYNQSELDFGKGTNYDSGQTAGFGGGGAFGYYYVGGDGGFGGGGGFGYYNNGGDGGFGAGAGGTEYSNNSSGVEGYGGSGNHAAAMGGGVFIRSGNVNFGNISFENNQALASNGAKGLGGALFILHSTSNSNGNNQGMPSTLATVSGCGVTYINNSASGDDGVSNNNNDIFDLANILNIVGTCDPEINILGDGNSILDGDSSPSIDDDTDFGTEFFNSGSIVNTFTIENNGGQNLELTGIPIVSLTGTDAGEFSITSQPVISTIPGLGSTIFEVTFAPTSIGLKTATISIDNNDSDENPYDFVIQGTGQGPEINLFGNNLTIVDGDTTPNINDFTNFGPIQQASLFSIGNSGVADLTLTGVPNISLSGVDAGEFSVTVQPSSNIVGASMLLDFEIEFVPSSLGIKTAVVTIENDDVDEGMYSFAIQGGELQEQEIEVMSNGIMLSTGDNYSPVEWNHVAVTNSLAEDVTFTISNTGNVDLNIFSLYTFGASSSEFTFVEYGNSVIPANTSTEILMRFNPYDSDVQSTTLRISSDDTDEGFFDINLFGTGIPAMSLSSGTNTNINEGEILNFYAELDVPAISDITVNYSISGDIDSTDFVSNSLTGNSTINAGDYGVLIDLPTQKDGVYEGPELVMLTIQSPNNDVIQGSSLAFGQIDDTLIFENGFEQITVRQLINNLTESKDTSINKPIFNETSNSIIFFDLELNLISEDALQNYNSVYLWLEQVLLSQNPKGDWDGDNIINQSDDDPFARAK